MQQFISYQEEIIVYEVPVRNRESYDMNVRISKKSYAAILIIILCVATITGCSKGTPTAPAPTTTSEPTASTSNMSTPNYYPYEDVKTTYQDAPAIITQASDGEELSVNLVKFVGLAPSSDAAILVNNTPVTENDDGSYYIYLDLNEGENTIEIKTIQGEKISRDFIHVFFTPPLAVYLDWPEVNIDDVDYSKTPLNITGKVTKPAANVTVNEVPVKVAQDGTFSTKVQLILGGYGSPQAIARLGNEADSDFVGLFLVPDGKIGVMPGQSMLKASRFELPHNLIDNLIKIRPGETSHIDVTLTIRKDFVDDNNSKFSITGVALNDDTEQPMPPGLQINISPMNFKIYYNIIYHFQINIKTSKELAAKEYRFRFNSYFGGRAPYTYITVDVKSP
jgi:hypothetical protein